MLQYNISFCIIGLQVFSLLALFSVEQGSVIGSGLSKSIGHFSMQLGYFSIFISLFWMIRKIPVSTMRKYSPHFYFGALILLLAVFLFGKVGLGAKRWLKLGPITIQPSEFMKMGLIFFLSYLGEKFLDARYNQLHYIRNRFSMKLFWRSALLIIIPVLFLLKQPDLGTAMMVLGVGLGVIITFGLPATWLIIGGFTTLLSMPILWMNLHEYQKKRILIFLNPDMDKLGAGYQISQSLTALGSAGWFGKGWMQGTQSTLGFVPEQHTDFIFTLLGEEFGFFGTSLLLLLYVILLVNLYKISQRHNSAYIRYVAFGTSTLIFLHVVCNVGMTLGLLPVVGIPLPLVSYGGSSLLTCCILLSVCSMDERVYGGIEYEKVI